VESAQRGLRRNRNNGSCAYCVIVVELKLSYCAPSIQVSILSFLIVRSKSHNREIETHRFFARISCDMNNASLMHASHSLCGACHFSRPMNANLSRKTSENINSLQSPKPTSLSGDTLIHIMVINVITLASYFAGFPSKLIQYSSL